MKTPSTAPGALRDWYWTPTCDFVIYLIAKKRSCVIQFLKEGLM